MASLPGCHLIHCSQGVLPLHRCTRQAARFLCRKCPFRDRCVGNTQYTRPAAASAAVDSTSVDALCEECQEAVRTGGFTHARWPFRSHVHDQRGASSTCGPQEHMPYGLLSCAAVMCDRRHRRLTLKAEHIREAAVKALQQGNDKDARRLLEVRRHSHASCDQLQYASYVENFGPLINDAVTGRS